jgi:hypothetical protein
LASSWDKTKCPKKNACDSQRVYIS